MKKNPLAKKQLILIIFNSILSVLVYVITYYLDPLNFSAQSSLAALPAFFLSVIVLIIGQNIATHSEVEKAAESSELTQETVKNYLHIVKIGNPRNAWQYIIDRLPVLEYVQNTSFNFEDEEEQTAERLYDDFLYQQSLSKIAKAVNQGLKWKDIGDASAQKRFQEIERLISGKCKGHYQYKLISQSDPQISFALLTYNDGTNEVLFNWDFRDIPQDPVVLLSRDNEILNMFAAQYRGLLRTSVEYYDSRATKSTS